MAASAEDSSSSQPGNPPRRKFHNFDFLDPGWTVQRVYRCHPTDPAKKPSSTPPPGGAGGAPPAEPLNLLKKKTACEQPSLAEKDSVKIAAYSRAKRSKKEEKRKPFSLQLSLAEIEMDFIAMTGSKRRPKKKRTKAVQDKINIIFPGAYLTEITEDMYKVRSEK